MIGTLVNCATILTGSFIGSRLKKGIREEHQEIMMQAMGLAATALGINAIVKYMPQSEYPVLFIVSLALGGLLGEKIHLEDRFKKFVTGFSNGNLAQGLSTAILLFCVGTLSILGPMESALKGDNTYLFTNAMLDFVTSSVLASTFGFGIALAAIVLFFWQGFFYCLALLLSGVMSPAIMAEISIIGGILIFSSGLSILGIKNFRTMNMLPAFLVPAVFFIVDHFYKQKIHTHFTGRIGYDRRKGIDIVVRKTNVVAQQNVRGGEGTVEFHHILKEEELYGHGKLYAKVVLKPHSSIGMHQHVGNTEPYFVLKGTGVFVDNDGSRTEVHSGDVCVIEPGQSHSMENNTDEDFEMMALIYNEAAK